MYVGAVNKVGHNGSVDTANR